MGRSGCRWFTLSAASAPLAKGRASPAHTQQRRHTNVNPHRVLDFITSRHEAVRERRLLEVAATWTDGPAWRWNILFALAGLTGALLAVWKYQSSRQHTGG